MDNTGTASYIANQIMNVEGPISIDDLPEMKSIPPDFKKAMYDKVLIVDVRAYDAFGGQFIPCFYSIDFEGNLPTMADWILPPEVDIVVVAENRNRAEETAKYLRRVGLDNVIGYLEGGMTAYNHLEEV